MTEPTRGADDEPNDEPKLMTRIDGEEARLLVHIEPIEDTEAGAETEEDPPSMGE
jgi:hypothetical protein